jgi:hypothetical protein
MSIQSFDVLIELQLRGNPQSYKELYAFFKNNGYIEHKDDEFDFAVALFGDEGYKWKYDKQTNTYSYNSV